MKIFKTVLLWAQLLMFIGCYNNDAMEYALAVYLVCLGTSLAVHTAARTLVPDVRQPVLIPSGIFAERFRY